MSTPNGPQDPYQPSGENPYGQQPPVYGQQPPVYGQQPGYPAAPPPGYGYGTPQGAPPPNYLVWSIITILLCTIPGIVAIVYSTQVNSKWGTGDAAGAYDASKKAKMWALIGTILGAVFIAAWIASGIFAATYQGS